MILLQCCLMPHIVKTNRNQNFVWNEFSEGALMLDVGLPEALGTSLCHLYSIDFLAVKNPLASGNFSALEALFCPYPVR